MYQRLRSLLFIINVSAFFFGQRTFRLFLSNAQVKVMGHFHCSWLMNPVACLKAVNKYAYINCYSHVYKVAFNLVP